MFNLWIKNNKISNLKQLKDFFDFDVVEMYLLGGSLVSWLKQCGNYDLAKQVKSIDLNADIPSQFAEIFGVKLSPSPEPVLPRNEAAPVSKNPPASFSSNQPLSFFEAASLPAESSFDTSTCQSSISSFENQGEGSSFTPQAFSSFQFSQLSETSFQAGSFEQSLTESSFSAATGSFSMLLSSFEQSSFSFENIINSAFAGSFNLSSFNISSFGGHEFEYEYEYQQGGSFIALQGSFSLGSFETSLTNIGSFNAGSFELSSFTTNTSFSGSFGKISADSQSMIAESSETALTELKPIDKIFLPKKEDDIPPEEKIKQNVLSCPLNRFGYGINLI